MKKLMLLALWIVAFSFLLQAISLRTNYATMIAVVDDLNPDNQSAVLAQKSESQTADAVSYEKGGNIPPRIEPRSAEQDANILKDVKVPEGFVATVFAAPPAVNYPVFVAASVDGTVYVSSDGNGSLGRDPQRGRVIRLRDNNGDGKADETKVFCEVDSPRGLLWDHDRLFVMHPPHLSVFIDRDQDGVADEQQVLVKNLAFGFDQRPADHTTNGISLGVDGWLYIAGGDFGFMSAEGSDGTKLTHRGGGVIRVRPDGTGLEVFSTGTRNILEVAISPQMDLFARDNTNDGGGWNVRFHHFTGMEDHGYPRLYMNFSDECVPPLADYGGGSGCGAVYVDEPGFGKWNNAPFTADWGTGRLDRHAVSPKGATFEETTAPQPFLKMPRPTDADIDGNSRLYACSWHGGQFRWQGPNVGYIVCVRPENFQPEPMPVFSELTKDKLVAVLDSPSYRRRMEAERELLRRGHTDFETLLQRGLAQQTTARNLLYRLQQPETKVDELIAALAHDDELVGHTAIRCLVARNAVAACLEQLNSASSQLKPVEIEPPAEMSSRARTGLLRALAMMHQPAVIDGLVAALRGAQHERRREILAALCRLYFQEGKWTGNSWGTRPDTRGPYYQPEAWSETKKIATVLDRELEASNAEDLADLTQTMLLHRIEPEMAVQRLLSLAESNADYLDLAINQLAQHKETPAMAFPMLQQAGNKPNASPKLLADTVVALVRLKPSDIETKNIAHALLVALNALDQANNAQREQSRAQDAFLKSNCLEFFVSVFQRSLTSHEPTGKVWINMALLELTTRKNVSMEVRELAITTITDAWQLSEHRTDLILAARKSRNHFLNESLLAAQDDPDASVAALAKAVVTEMKIKPLVVDRSAKIGTLKLTEVMQAAISNRGDVALGEQVFTRANCQACHTVREGEALKGPYLGNIAKTYKRPELATAILEPGKTIAQGFITQRILTINGLLINGFVTDEQSDRVTVRDQEGKEHLILKDDIEERKVSEISVMPTGLMQEFSTHELSSLLDYLESLSK